MQYVVQKGEKRSACRDFEGKPDANRPLERPRHEWQDSVKSNIQEVRLESVDWIHLAQDRKSGGPY